MRNRAKCKLCNSIIESFHSHDYVSCDCDEISVDGGSDFMRASAKNWENFIRIDEEDNEIPVKVIEKETEIPQENLSHQEESLLDFSTFFQMVENLNSLPEYVKDQAVTNRDLYHFFTAFISDLKK